MKRHGNLYPQIVNQQALLAAYKRARSGKRTHRACHMFERRLGAEIEELLRALQDGSYQPHAVNRFEVFERGKRRLIEAPAFRDLVVQHAVYAVVMPLFDRRFIDTSFACRVGKGVHKAADWLQEALRMAPRGAWVLHVDARKYFYSIDRRILAQQVRRVIKCPRTLYLLDLFAERDETVGVPIGGLLSQVYANVYLNDLDQYCKRALKVQRYGRYMDDVLLVAPDYETGQQWLQSVRQRMAGLHLDISHYSLHPIRRGANFAGFRTWRRGRFVRKRVIRDFYRAVRRNDLVGVVSRLAHARRTCSWQPMLRYLEKTNVSLYRQVPKSLHRLQHYHAAHA